MAEPVPTPATGLRLGEYLVQAGSVRAPDRDAALAHQAAHGGRIGTILVRMGSLSEETLYLALSAQWGLPIADCTALSEAELAAGLQAWPFSADWWLRQQALPWCDLDGTRHVAAVDPMADDLRETLQAADDGHLQWQLALPVDYERTRHRLDRPRDLASATVDAQALRALAEDAPVVNFVNNVLAEAVQARASDIHLEPGEREFSVKLRIDGVLHLRSSMPMARYAAIASRVKLVSGLDIAERRLPQDGRTSIRAAGVQMDVRVSAIPSVHGESLVLRLLPKERADLSLDRLGMQADHLGHFRRWLQWHNGLVLVTGPTGSGKSTTLYAALAAVNDLSRKIVTVEDPVEFRLPHVVQIQTQAEIGYTFARALRSILRHDPDVIMVGEIRDRETAEIAVQSALTGHLVLATLHTNDALSAVTRLVDMGIEPYLVAAALKATMAQRLVRRLCPVCAVLDSDPSALEQRWQALATRAPALPAAPARWMRAVGCPACQDTGYRGRVGIYELVAMTDGMQHAVAAGAPLADVQVLADAAGRRSLAEDGLVKARAGITTFDEVLRAAGTLVAD